jgi:hypothetical protein
MTANFIVTAIGAAVAGVLLVALVIYLVRRSYVARSERTFMTHDERGFKRALSGKGVLWDFEEHIVKGAHAPRVEFVAFDPATGQRRAGQLLDPRTGAVNLRPQYCVPLPFIATTADGHRMLVEARVQFSLNRELLKHVYQVEDFALALETRIHSAFRGEIGKRADEDLRSGLNAVEDGVIERLRKAERDGDEAGELGMALGVVFHTANFTFTPADDHFDGLPVGAMSLGASPASPPAAGDAAAAPLLAARAVVRSHGVLALRPQQLDLLADVFKNRDPASTAALLAMLEMQTRQNIAEALAGSGQLVVVTGQELGLASATTQRDAITRLAETSTPPAKVHQNGAAHPG